VNSGGLSPQQVDLLQALLREEGIAVGHTAIPARDHGLHPPMSVIQEQMWFTEQLSPGNSFYHLGPVHRLHGPLDVAALRQALTAVVARHSVLRSHYPEVGGSPVQSITPPAPYPLTMVDVADRADPESAAFAIAAEAMNRRFDLATDDLLRAVLIRLSDDDHIAVFAFQHIVADGASVQIFLDELEKLYAAAVSGVAANLPALALQYADFAAWQREWLGTDEARRQAQYWRDRLVGAPELLDIPTDHPRPRVQSYAGAAVVHVEHGDLVARLEELARREGVSLFMVVLAALQVVLAKYTGETDVVVGTPTAGRPAPEFDGLIGCFFNILPLRTDLSGNPSLHDILTRVRDTALDAYARQDVPFQRVIEDLGPKRNLSHNQITQVLLRTRA
jgi:hypothetical protein